MGALDTLRSVTDYISKFSNLTEENKKFSEYSVVIDGYKHVLLLGKINSYTKTVSYDTEDVEHWVNPPKPVICVEGKRQAVKEFELHTGITLKDIEDGKVTSWELV